jgi:hypothetical protein
MNTILAMQRLPHACAMALALSLAGQACAGGPATPAPGQIGTPTVAGTERGPIAPAPLAREHGDTFSIDGDQVQAVDLDKLEHERGRADTVLNDTKLNGDVAQNSAVNVNTGSNTIDAGSFANMSGIPVVIQNSGANVLIQNATVVNLQFQ